MINNRVAVTSFHLTSPVSRCIDGNKMLIVAVMATALCVISSYKSLQPEHVPLFLGPHVLSRSELTLPALNKGERYRSGCGPCPSPPVCMLTHTLDFLYHPPWHDRIVHALWGCLHRPLHL